MPACSPPKEDEKYTFKIRSSVHSFHLVQITSRVQVCRQNYTQSFFHSGDNWLCVSETHIFVLGNYTLQSRNTSNGIKLTLTGIVKGHGCGSNTQFHHGFIFELIGSLLHLILMQMGDLYVSIRRRAPWRNTGIWRPESDSKMFCFSYIKLKFPLRFFNLFPQIWLTSPWYAMCSR